MYVLSIGFALCHSLLDFWKVCASLFYTVLIVLIYTFYVFKRRYSALCYPSFYDYISFFRNKIVYLGRWLKLFFKTFFKSVCSCSKFCITLSKLTFKFCFSGTLCFVRCRFSLFWFRGFYLCVQTINIFPIKLVTLECVI